MKYVIFFLTLTLSILSCSESRTAILWSSNEEAADLAELYNNTHDEYRIIFQYKKDLVSSYIQADKKPDLIIGDDLQNMDIKSLMLNLNSLYNRNFNGEDQIIPSLMNGAEIDDEIKILPLSFSLTAAVFKRDSKRIDERLPSLDLALMRDLSISYNLEQKKRGYSPYWDNDFIFAVLELYGSSFASSDKKTLSWNQENLDSALEFMKTWNEQNGGMSEMSFFNDKFLYDNRIKILKEERILLTIMNSSRFLTLSDNMSRELGFLYVSHDNKLHPERIVYGGITKTTKEQNAASDFLTWLMTEKAQVDILESSLKNKTGGFAILGGFSSLSKVNSLILPQYYPRLAGKIPEPSYILPQSEKPVDFKNIKYKLITSWVLEKSEGNELTFSEALDKWEELRIPF